MFRNPSYVSITTNNTTPVPGNTAVPASYVIPEPDFEEIVLTPPIYSIPNIRMRLDMPMISWSEFGSCFADFYEYDCKPKIDTFWD